MPKLMMLVVFVALILPLASSKDAADLETYLDCAAIKNVDIVFVFDTTNSMGGEISELRAVANKFATDLEASNIDFQLGLVEFRDFPKTCDGFSCGSPGDFAYQVKGNGTLTSDISTFNSWLKELKAGGGGSPGPEAVLAALRHAATDMTWRTDAEKAIIILTDAGPHPDGSCCNAEGDTLEGTVFTLTDQGARVYVIGPDDASLKQIAESTGGQFYEIRSGLSLKPLLEKITQSMSCTFNATIETTCENKQLEATVQLVGKETVPYVKGQTEVWMYLDQAGSISRYNLSFDPAEEVYKAEVPDVCGSVEMTIYGRVGERSAAQTVHVECGTCGAAAVAEAQGSLSISGRIFDDSNEDGIKDVDVNEAGLEGWVVLLEGPDGYSADAKTDRKGFYIFTGLKPGGYALEAVSTQDDWVATNPEEEIQTVELVDSHESEIDFGFKLALASLPLEIEPELIKVLGVPSSDIDCIAFSPDGRTLASGAANGTVSLWDMESGSVLRTLSRHSMAVARIAFSPDGFTLASTSLDQKVTLWDAESGTERQTLDAAGIIVAFSPDSSKLNSMISDGTVIQWDVESGTKLRTFNTASRIASTRLLNGVAFSSDGRTLALTEEETITLWDVESETKLQTLDAGKPLHGHGVAFSPDGRTLALVERDTVTLWDVESGTNLQTLDIDTIPEVVFSPDGRILASTNFNDGAVTLWDVQSGNKLWVTSELGGTGTAAFSPDGKTLASGGVSRKLRLWDVESGIQLRTLGIHTGEVIGVAFSPDGRTLASGIDNGTVVMWDVESGTKLWALDADKPLDSVAFSLDGRTLAWASIKNQGYDGAVTLWDMESRTELQTLDTTDRIYSMTFSPDGRTLALGSFDHTVTLWDVESGTKLQTLDMENSVRPVVFSPDGRILASTTNFNDGAVTLWNVENGTELRKFDAADEVRGVAFSPDGRTLALGSFDHTVTLWDVESGTKLQTLDADGAADVAFSPDGRTLAGANFSYHTVTLWGVESGIELWTLDTADDVTSVAFSPDGRTLALGLEEGTIGLWRVA